MAAKNAGDSTVISIQAKPGAKTTGISFENGIVTVRVRARAVEGAANDAVVEAFAAHLAIPKSRVRIESGERARHKRIRIAGMTESDVAAALNLRK